MTDTTSFHRHQRPERLMDLASDLLMQAHDLPVGARTPFVLPARTALDLAPKHHPAGHRLGLLLAMLDAACAGGLAA